ncbi:MAG: hypothetical protein DWQ07_17240 [Chloroflexi bacterium]|nr:MAG: hypothetical protein DWQ07_17240 [Chloroflexota bacterium]MBL1195151.1 hypothetical protein [Chloroflexota bacterium]NOH12436.1 tyrosine-type recombinase/integrase [Chloroflexota bacterium]
MAKKKKAPTVAQAADLYLEGIKLARSHNTWRTYMNAIQRFLETLKNGDVDINRKRVGNLDEEVVSWFTRDLKELAPATERLYLSAVSGFFKYLHAEDLAQPNLPRIQQLIQMHARRSGQRLPQFPRAAIEDILKYVAELTQQPVDSQRELLINLRDRALLLTLADTGLRIHEACNLRRGDIDWNEGRAIVIGKGDHEAIVRFSSRSMRAIKQYLNERSTLDGGSGKPLPTLPLFARHDKRIGTKVLPMSTTTGRNIVQQRVAECLGQDAVGTITPHSFRHYFVTTVMQVTGGNLKMAQDLARHKSIQVTQRYAHLSEDELDKGYYDVFEGSN